MYHLFHDLKGVLMEKKDYIKMAKFANTFDLNNPLKKL